MGVNGSYQRADKVPRVVVVTRPTEYQLLLDRHGTRAQAAFFLETRGQSMEAVEERHRLIRLAVDQVQKAIPLAWRRASVRRADLDRFLFEPDDLLVAVGQDGLVANTAKYLSGQPVIGINPSPELFDGVLVRHPPAAAADLLSAVARSRAEVEGRTMVEARLADGERLLALNEVFVGHRSHQSARYVIGYAGGRERHSSSGLIVTTGTGASGWARSITRNRRSAARLPEPGDRRLAFLVREAFPSVATGTNLTDGVIDHGTRLWVKSEMSAGGIIFGDGIESDRLDFHWGREVEIGVAPTPLRLVA